MLDPALSIVSEAIRNGPNLDTTLRGGSVASAALIYRHRAPRRDHDFSSYFTPASPTRQTFKSKKDVKREPNYDYSQYDFTKGFCFRFQLTNKCDKTDCPYYHKCCACDSSSHGKNFCSND